MGLCVWHFPEFSTDMDKLRGYIRNVTFSNMHINACDYSFFGGKDVKDIQLDNIKMHIKRYPEAYKGERVLQFPEYPSIWGRGYLPEPITIYPGSGVSLENVSVTETK